MAKDNRVIRRAIRVEETRNANEGRTMPDGVTPAPYQAQTVATVYGPDQEDELAVALPQQRLDELVKSGELEGDWKHIESPTAQEPAEATEAPVGAPIKPTPPLRDERQNTEREAATTRRNTARQ